MSKHDWPALVKAQVTSGETIAAFCAARGLTRSKFYTERARQCSQTGVVPIVVEVRAVQITLQLRTPVVVAGSASDLAQILRCL